jgi:hypothetical protein
MTKYEFLWSKMTLSGIISKKTSKSPGRILTNTSKNELNECSFLIPSLKKSNLIILI